ncbi:MAG: hypothetical protein FWC47_15860, partial [Oscillospiraceae bacterium]|nr:hypothetical protein [Oscillospiraceae bacterium]
IETSPIGQFEDIFFHFESEYKGDDIAFEASLYQEFLSCFDVSDSKEYIDILALMRNDGLLLSEFQPNRNIRPTAKNLWNEMLRMKSCIKELEKKHFCICFPLPANDGKNMTDWYKDVLSENIPEGIRLVTVDYAERRKVKLSSSSKVYIIRPELKMEEALNNEIDKGSYISNTVGAEGRFRKQIRIVLDCSQKQDKLKLEKEINKLLDIAKEMEVIPTIVGTNMIVSLAWFYAKDNEKCEDYADKAISESERYMAEGMDLYPTWKGAVMLKAAMLMMHKKRREAIIIYERLAETATDRGDAFFIMEGYRLVGHLYYELSEYDNAFEHTLLALAGGSYLDKEVRRQSTFLQAANLALYLSEKTRKPEDTGTIEAQLKDWLGDDWESLVKTEDMNKSHIRRKASIFA